MADFRGADLRQANMGGAYIDGAMMPAPTAEKGDYQKLLDEKAAEGKTEAKTKEKGRGR